MESFLLILTGATLAFGLVWYRQQKLTFMGQTPEDFAGKGPEFDLREHLKGPILCEGVIYGPTGRVSSRFVADMDASWDGNVGVMTEKFHYDSGDTQDREWRLTLGNDGSIKAEAPDVVGTGTGQQKGPGVVLNYKIKLPEQSGGHVLDATDWMYLVDNGAIINRSQFRKYGFKVAELVATMRRKDAA
ncbi:MAG: DUF3833 family protein [Rhodobacteraceae bacterium]|nr:DUF3833 domain-containing protein [Alphaproteobacteria bacterium]MBT8476444.1 DUF3833 domain-containing protein [Alphaproteobacteria bacterium]NNK66732.1 DUF3833 family protein [Paracoccaceae bacterium]